MLAKTFVIRERFRAQFRWEALNMMNTPAWGQPSTVLGNASFGAVINAGSRRIMQWPEAVVLARAAKIVVSPKRKDAKGIPYARHDFLPRESQELNLDAAGNVSLFEPMYCTNCGQQIRDESHFCSQCGKSTRPEALPPAGVGERLVRIREGKKIAGVCNGFARYMAVDVTLVRVVWLVIALTAGVGFIAYLVAWIAMPLVDTPLYSRADAHPGDGGNTLAKI